MHVLGPALAGALAIIAPMAAHASEPGSNWWATNAGSASNFVLVGDSGGSGGHSGAMGAGRVPQQWNGGPGFAHWGPNRQYGGWGSYGGPPVPTYWVWVPGSAVFDYPFADWRGPTGGWGNP